MRIKNYLMAFIVITSFTLIASCDAENGIAPKPDVVKEFGFGGNIVFYGVWPDSIEYMVLIVFKDPLITPLDFSVLNVGFLRNPLPLGIQYIQYSSSDSAIIPIVQFEIPPSVYHYVAVASSKVLSLSRKDWFVRGVYYANGDTTMPGILTIPENTYVDDVNIICDFENPPPQPPGGN